MSVRFGTFRWHEGCEFSAAFAGAYAHSAVSMRSQTPVSQLPSMLGQRCRKELSILQHRMHSFPGELEVDSTLDIFQRLPDSNFTRVAAVGGLKEARRRIKGWAH
jgi:hypothetical protein